MISAAVLLFTLLASAPSAAPTEGTFRDPAVAARAADLRRGWVDLDARARAFLRMPVVASSLRGGGVAIDRAALFSAADRALTSGRAGYSLTLLDVTGDPVAWAGRAPTVFPSGEPFGAIWSAESVVFYRTLVFAFPPEVRAGRLVEAWRLSRLSRGALLSPAGTTAWNPAGGATWGGIDAAPARDARARARRFAIVAYAIGSLILLVAALIRAPTSPVGASAASALALLWGAAGAASLTPAPLKLQVADYAREPALIGAFVVAIAAAALFGRRGFVGSPFALLAALALAAFLVGTLWPTPGGVALGFGLALIVSICGSGPAPLRIFGTAALTAAALYGPLVLWSQERAIAANRVAAARARQQGLSPDSAAARAAGDFPSRIAGAAARFVGAQQQDLGDLAFVLWKETGLARDAPISGVRLWREGRLISRFSSGIPADAGAAVDIAGERFVVSLRRIAIAPRAEFSPGEAPEAVEIETVGWPVWRPLPDPYREYRELLLGLESPAPADSPKSSERFLESLTAGSAAVLGCLGLAVAGGSVLLLSSRRRVHLRPLTFRGRITGLFTVLVLVPFLAVTIYTRHSLAIRLRRETLVHAQTALETARTVLDDYLFSAGTSPGRRQLIDDGLLSWMAKIVGHDLSIYTDGKLFSSSRRELFASGLLPERIDGGALGRILRSPGGFVVETRVVLHRPFDQVEATLASIPGRMSLTGPAVLSIPLLPEQRETEEEIARLSASLTLFTLAVFGLSLLLGARTAFRVTGPIGALVEGTHAVARGETPAIALPDDEELKRLVEAFLSMAATLEKQRDDLARAQRLRAWAEMARIIAHEIKNPLTPIRLSAEHLREVWKRSDPSRDRVLEECVTNILKQTEVLRGIAAEFSDYARLPEPHRESVALAALADGVVSAYRAAAGIEWVIDVPDVEVVADAKLVARALTNLVANAREALGKRGGRIAIRLKRDGQRWVFRVEDDGPGVAAEDMKKLFEPYFSSKSGGSGLGLAIVRKIAQEHGGDVRAERLSPRGFAVEFDFADGSFA